MDRRSETGWLPAALLLTGLIVGLRIVALWFNATDLFVDEAQYWLWGQGLDFGYYSKPPMIAWVIRAFTEVCGDGPFCVRLPAPLLHGVTALALGAVAARLWGRRGALAVVLGYLTLPMVALGSLLISTDTVMFPFLALALLAYVACLQGAGPGVALAGGLALGLGFLSKYAAVYLILCAILASGLRPRLSWTQAGAFLLGVLIAASPNILWNLWNGLTTVEHTLDNADWVRDPGHRAALNLSGLAEFFFAQFAVFGPVLFAALLVLGATWARRDGWTRRWLLFALPIVAVVCVQAVLSRAYANWAASAYLAGSLAVLPWLALRARAWLGVSLAVNAVVCLAFPLFTVLPSAVAFGGHSPVERHLGRAATSQAILNAARAEGLETVVVADRDLLADLFYTGRDAGLTYRAPAPRGRAPHHYALAYPFDGAPETPVLYIAFGIEPVCDRAESLGLLEPKFGAYRGKQIGFWRVPGACLSAG